MLNCLLGATVVLILLFGTNGENTLCVREDASCAYQLWSGENYSEDACRMKYFALNGDECRSLSFSSKSSTRDTLGDFKISAYTADKYAVLFNLSFSDIKWDAATYRFLERADLVEYDDNICTARSFTLQKHPENSVLYYDCGFLDALDEGKVFNVDLELSKAGSVQIRKLLVKVLPYHALSENVPLKSRQLFTYVDYTNPSSIVLKIHPLQTAYNVSDYKIEVWRERDGKITKMDVRFVNVASAVGGELQYEYNTWQEWGNYFFTVSVVNDICPEDKDLCTKTVTPKVILDRRNNKLVIGIVGASVIIPILLYTVWMWNKQCNSKESLVDFSEIKALLIYTPQTDLHNSVVISFAHTLKKLFTIDVMMDIFDIPDTKHKNPRLWCGEAFQRATHIVYITPPNTEETYPPVYATEPMALRFLEEYLASGRSNKKIVSVTFPYSRGNIPDFFRNFRHFHLMKDFSAFITYLENYNRQNVFLWRSVFKRNQLMYYSENSCYLDLIEAIKRAQEEEKLTKKLAKVTKPEIKIVLPSEENIAGKEENENATLIEKEGEYSVDIKTLGLSGEKDEDLEEIVLTMPGKSDIRSLDL